MERNLHLRLSGVVFTAGAVLGLVLSMVGLVWLWVGKEDVTNQVTGTVSLFGGALSATHELIGVTGTTLDEAAKDIETVNTMISDVAETMKNSSGVVDSTSNLIGGDMVDFVGNTQKALASVENSAKAVDSILKSIVRIPLIGSALGGGYNPDVPLQASVADVSRSMDTLPDALTKISRDLDVSSANIATIQAEVAMLGGQIGAIQDSLTDAQGVVEQYKTLLDDVQKRYDAFEKRLPGMINGVYAVLTLALVWVLLSSAGMMVYGTYLLR